VPVVGAREPCPCGSGRKYKACHGKAADDRSLTSRPFAGLPDEVEWVALREIVPAATARLQVREAPDRDVLLTTLLPLAWPALVRADRRTMLGLQVPTRSGDVSRDLAWALEQALVADPGHPVQLLGLPGPGPRLQDLLVDAPLEITVHQGFDYWVEGAADPTGDVAASLEQANASVVPPSASRACPAPTGAGCASAATCAGCCRTTRSRRWTPWPASPPDRDCRWATAPATSGRSARTACSCRCGTCRSSRRRRRWPSR
jgi:hypothetical protein